MASINDLLAQRDDLLTQARARTPGLTITPDPVPDDPEGARTALVKEIGELAYFITRPGPNFSDGPWEEEDE